MKIGALARATGLSVHAIRYYESEGLLAPAGRTESGYRVFGLEDLERVEFIRRARGLGLTLSEVKDILAIKAREQATCTHVRWLLEQKVEEVDRTLSEIQEFRRLLVGLLAHAQGLEDCRPAGGRICGIIEGAPKELLWPTSTSLSSAAARPLSPRRPKQQS